MALVGLGDALVTAVGATAVADGVAVVPTDLVDVDPDDEESTATEPDDNDDDDDCDDDDGNDDKIESVFLSCGSMPQLVSSV